MTTPSNNNHHLIEMPIVTGRWSRVAQISSNWRTKLQKPTAHGFVGDVQSSFRQLILYVSKAQSEARVEPICVANDVRRKSMA